MTKPNFVSLSVLASYYPKLFYHDSYEMVSNFRDDSH